MIAAATALGCEVGDILDLSASLNPFAPDVTSIVASAAARSVSYPDETRATSAMAEALGEPAERVVLTNGAAEAIAVLASMHPVGDVTEPEFSLYRRHLDAVATAAPRWRSNPSAPLGRLARPDEQAFVWDESFLALATGRWTRGDTASWRIASLTKTWRCPGLRIGFAIAPDDAAAAEFRRRRPEWSVNAMACAAVEQLAGSSDLGGWSQAVRGARRSLCGELASRGLSVADTDASWVLRHDARHLVEPLFDRRVLVRELTSYGQPGMVRIAVGNSDETERFLAALDETLR